MVDDLFSREEVLGGMPAQRARTLLFLIESRTAHLVARSRHAMERFSSEQVAEEQDMAFLEAFTAGKDPPLRPTIQDLEQFARQWASLVPDSPVIRAALARLLGEKYTFTSQVVPDIRQTLGLEEETVQRAFQRNYKVALATIYSSNPGLGERLRWGWAIFVKWIEALPPFWTAFALTLTETIGAGILALPIALAGVGPIAGVILLVVLGLVNVATIAYMAESVSRSGNIRYGNAYFGRFVADFLGKDGSLTLSLALLMLNFLALSAYFIGFSTILEDAIRVPAPVWVALLFLVNIYFLRRRSLNATVSAALVVGAVNIGLILMLVAITFPSVQVERLSYLNMPLINGQPFDPALVQLIFGVILTAFFGHTSMGNCAKVVLRRDPSAHSLMKGSTAAIAIAITIYTLWVVAVNGTIPPSELAGQTGTALTPLAAQVGPFVYVLGAIFAILSMGMASIHISLSFFNQIQEWLPQKRQSLIQLSRRHGTLLFYAPGSQKNELRLGLVYLGLEGGQACFRLDVLNSDQTYHLETTTRSRLNGTELLSQIALPGERGAGFTVDIMEASADSVRMQVTTSMRLSYSEEWDRVGLDATGLLELSESQRQVMDRIIRTGEASFSDLARQTKLEEQSLQGVLNELVTKGFVRVVETQGGKCYRAQLIAKRGRELPTEIWQALEGTPEARPSKSEPKGKLPGFFQRAWEHIHNERIRFFLALIPVAFTFLLTEWLLLTGSESFSELISFLGVIVISLLGGIFPVLLLIASRRKGEYVPGRVFRFLGHPVLVIGIYLLSLSGLFLHGLLIWQNPVQRAVAIITGLLIIGMTIAMFRRGVFAPRAVIEIRQDQAENGKVEYSIVSDGSPTPADVQLGYSNGEDHRHAAQGEIPEVSGLHYAQFLVTPGQYGDLKVWVHRINPDGDSEGMAARLEVELGGKVKQMDLGLMQGQALIPLPTNWAEKKHAVKIFLESKLP